MTIPCISFRDYTHLFYYGFPEGFRYQETPIQLYNLKQVSNHLKTLITINMITLPFQLLL